MSKSGVACYRNGGCGPYEMYSCSECPASKSDYVQFKRKPITNYDRIVSKTPEELAEWIAGGVLNLTGGSLKMATEAWAAWLRNEASL